MSLPINYVVSLPVGGDRNLAVGPTSVTLAAVESARGAAVTLGVTPPYWNPQVSTSITYTGSAKDWLTVTAIAGGTHRRSWLGGAREPAHRVEFGHHRGGAIWCGSQTARDKRPTNFRSCSATSICRRSRPAPRVFRHRIPALTIRSSRQSAETQARCSSRAMCVSSSSRFQTCSRSLRRARPRLPNEQSRPARRCHGASHSNGNSGRLCSAESERLYPVDDSSG